MPISSGDGCGSSGKFEHGPGREGAVAGCTRALCPTTRCCGLQYRYYGILSCQYYNLSLSTGSCGNGDNAHDHLPRQGIWLFFDTKSAQLSSLLSTSDFCSTDLYTTHCIGAPSRMKAAPRQGRPRPPSFLSACKITPQRARKPLATAAFFPYAILLAILWLCALVQAAPQAPTSSSQSGQNATTSAQGGGNSTNTTVVPLGTRAHHGLGEDWMQVNSIYIGFLPDWSR
jgi:hypothetical protein